MVSCVCVWFFFFKHEVSRAQPTVQWSDVTSRAPSLWRAAAAVLQVNRGLYSQSDPVGKKSIKKKQSNRIVYLLCVGRDFGTI